jgi:hypothetical protein
LLRSYAGIGSRETPDDVLALMRQFAVVMAGMDWTLRSGCAPGADSAFEEGALAVAGKTELFLPWPGFEGRSEDMVALTRPSAAAYEVSEKHHPAWEKLSRGARALQARNAHQVLGADLKSPVKFVLCWTKDAKRRGGTGQALRIAEAMRILIFDVGDPVIYARVRGFVTHTRK